MRFILISLLFLNLLNANSKVALLIGNQDYNKQNLQLKNPINDIEAIEETLEGIGFEVELLKNATKREMEDELDDFYRRAEGKEIALVYFSGHGLQVFDRETQRVKNYLLPIDANVEKLRDLKKLMELDTLIADSTSAKKSIVLIDACRDNPLYAELQRFFRQSGTRSVSTSKGLGQVQVTTDDVLIGLATGSNQVASDGLGDLSPYAQALSVHLGTVGDISLVLRSVRKEVLQSTNNTQEPEIIDKLTSRVCLSGDCGDVKVVERVVEKDVNVWLFLVIGGLVVSVLIILKIYHRKVQEVNTIKSITIIDGLMYQNQPFTETYSWEEAKEYAKNLRLGGYDDWRLPTRNELDKIMVINKNGEYYIRKEFVANMEEYHWFWSSKTNGKDSSIAWGVYFKNGYDYWLNLSNYNFALCVR